MDNKLLFDVAHLLAGSMLVLSFLLLYQDRITAVRFLRTSRRKPKWKNSRSSRSSSPRQVLCDGRSAGL